MKCQILFSWRNKKNISVCCLLKILLRGLSVKFKEWFGLKVTDSYLSSDQSLETIDECIDMSLMKWCTFLMYMIMSC